jgi:hypothetical protein
LGVEYCAADLVSGYPQHLATLWAGRCYNKGMNDRKNLWVWVGIVVVVIVAGAGTIIWVVNREQTPQTGPIPVHAPVGQVVAGFPQELILGVATSGTEGSVAGVTNSYSINYSSSTNQYTAEWNSSSTLVALYTQYQSYIAANGWTIINQADYPTLKGIYAMNSSMAAVNIVIVSENAGSKVTVSYVVQ